jgi:hypothetical protein
MNPQETRHRARSSFTGVTEPIQYGEPDWTRLCRRLAFDPRGAVTHPGVGNSEGCREHSLRPLASTIEVLETLDAVRQQVRSAAGLTE